MIPVTKPFLPPKEEYEQFVSDIWRRNWLTNHGPLVDELEAKLKEYLDVEHFFYVSNGTIAIQLAIQALALSGEIITTPFSYVATTSSIVWEKCTPVFADIDPHTLNIDPACIEDVISENTVAILATHVYGNPCSVDEIAEIAQKYGLKVIYDAAHCFGTQYKEQSILNYGDISTLSFHATKLFHTIEGGAIVTNNKEWADKLHYLRNFGHDGPEQFHGVGINGKNSEFHAAMGHCNLKYIHQILEKRKADYQTYMSHLKGLPIKEVKITPNTSWNYAYIPILFETEEDCLNVFNTLKTWEVFARRYFYPSLNTLPYIKQVGMPVAEDIASRVLCLPSYYTLAPSEISLVCRIIARELKK